jgi:hypothetical protein
VRYKGGGGTKLCGDSGDGGEGDISGVLGDVGGGGGDVSKGLEDGGPGGGGEP